VNTDLLLDERHLRADTLSVNVQGLLRPLTIAPPGWPLIDALRQTWGEGLPLTWLEAPPTTESPALEKAPLAGTVVNVRASMGIPQTVAAWTNLSAQAARSSSAVSGVREILGAQVASDADGHVADLLLATAAPATGMNDAIALLADWPGQRIVVLGANAISEIRFWSNYAEEAGGALRLVIDPGLTVSMAIARVGVAVGVIGPTPLSKAKADHLGLDISEQVTLVVEAAIGAVTTWTPE
jgi:hypothetical protein